MGEISLNYTTIQHGIRKKLGISLIEYILCDAIYHFSHDPSSVVLHWCCLSKKSIAVAVDVDSKTVFRAINFLMEKKLLIKDPKTFYLQTTPLWYEEVIIGNQDKMSDTRTKCPTPVQNDWDKMSHLKEKEKESNTKKEKKKETLNLKKINPVISLTVNSKQCTLTDNCGNCAKCSLVACTELQIWEIAKNKDVWIDEVKSTHKRIMSLIGTGEFQKKYKHKTVYYTLQDWIQLNIRKGYIQKMDDMQRLLLADEHPDIRLKVKNAITALKKKGFIT